MKPTRSWQLRVRTRSRLVSYPPLISGPEKGYTAHYRDPHVFERNGEWWMVIGAQREDLTGAVVVYTSADRREWTFRGELGIKDKSLEGTYMYECPSC